MNRPEQRRPAAPRPRGRLEIAREVLDAHRSTGQRPRDLLAEMFRAETVEGPERAKIARAVYRTIQQERRVAFALGGLDRLEPALRVPALLVSTLVLDGELTPDRAAELLRPFGRAPIDWRKVLRADERIGRVEDPIEQFGLRHSIPTWLATRFVSEFGVSAGDVAEALNETPPRTIRANLLKVPGRDALAEELLGERVPTRPTTFASHGLIAAGDRPLFELPAFREGRFEQQDESSQLCADIVAPPPRGRVLDACAGGGGKALAIAAELQNRGEVLAVDVHAPRLDTLVPRRRRAGVDVIRSIAIPADAWPDEVAAFARRADRILLDVPCSGIGSWRRRADARWELTPAGCDAMRATQRELLDRAIAHLAPGARVIYATCTMFRDENEDQVAAALERHPQLEQVRVAELLGGARAGPITDPTGTCLRLWPQVHGTDGFFAAVLRRRRG